MTDRPSKALDLNDIVFGDEKDAVNEVAKVRARTKFVPGFTEDTDPTHLTRTFMGYTALCGHYPVEYIGYSPSDKFCRTCLSIADDYELNRER